MLLILESPGEILWSERILILALTSVKPPKRQHLVSVMFKNSATRLSA